MLASPKAKNTPVITLILHNIRSCYNVGAILRTAEGLGVAAVAFSGYTPRVHDPALLPHLRAKQDRSIAKSALGAEQLVPLVTIDNLPAYLEEQKSHHALVLGLENNLAPAELPRRLILGQDPIPCLTPSPQSHQNTQRPQRPISPSPSPHLILLLGEEVHGIPPELRHELDYFLEIPMSGRKESFNVSVATAIALWELLK